MVAYYENKNSTPRRGYAKPLRKTFEKAERERHQNPPG
jgi:hypothetical protein